ncbi:hypothetical protein [Actinomadura rubrisoli]|uniref:Uncharacterized protein n=1 Tax=Actinomadura rubrisoli TaxID=2530368 RepID=A0A4V2YZR9_9ACTN|nr:hypothetical protein [Actinomadura rubrisoli]TDD98177.1 hypothetical protein E1298_00500 [Actinomadura rubrisoli]
MCSKPRPVPSGRIRVRAVVALGVTCLAGATAGLLSFASSGSLARALLDAGTAIGATAGLLNQIVSLDPPPVHGSESDQ